MPEQEQGQAQQPTQGATIEQIQQVVDDAMQVQQVSNDGLAQDVRTLAAGVESLRAAASEGSANTAVTLDSSQWDTLEAYLAQSSESLKVSLFLNLVLLLVVAALLGERLWAAFSRGWRR